MSNEALFTLVDLDGQEHHYRCNRHPGGAGLELVLSMVEIGVGPLIEVVKAAFSNLDELKDLDSKKLSELLKTVDLSGTAVEIRKALASGRAPDLMRSLFAHTDRDGKSLGSPTFYDQAWMGNYAEPFHAAMKIIEHNRFFALLESLSDSETEAQPATSP